METKDYSAKELQELAGAGEPEKVCICDNPYAQHSLRYHQDDCAFFEDYSNSDSGYVY